jgi:selenophosphate synthase
MNTSNGMSLSILQRHGVRALTDVTGFGLIGHLGEMLRASQCGVELRLAEIPILTGGLQLARQGVRSSIQRANAQALNDFTIMPSATGHRSVESSQRSTDIWWLAGLYSARAGRRLPEEAQ